ncbi:MAG: hypothetical protein KAI83_11355 [Thiomargarita sp.]|nr:hypothetical protein [Thiomargarita sp.]
MPTITLNSRISSDGFLHLKVPSTLRGTECKITVILQPLTTMVSKPKTPEELGWTPGFFEKTAGAWEGEPLTREEQGEYEQREVLL